MERVDGVRGELSRSDFIRHAVETRVEKWEAAGARIVEDREHAMASPVPSPLAPMQRYENPPDAEWPEWV